MNQCNSPNAENSRIDGVLAKIRDLDRSWTGATFGTNRETRLWPLGEQSAELLALLVLISDARRILELGTSAGYSTIVMARATHFSAEIITIENDPQKIEMAKANFCEAGVEQRVKLVQGDIEKILLGAQNLYGLDLVFLDADKPSYAKYFQILKSRLNVGGLVVADNVVSHRDQLEDFIATVQSSEEFTVKLWPHEAGMLIAKRTR